MQQAILSEMEILNIISALPDHMLQGRRMIEYLSQNQESPSGYVAHHCGIGNLSDVARHVNKIIFPMKMMIACERPPIPIHNKFGEPSNQFLWSIYAIPEAANDPDYSLKKEG